MRKIIGRIPMLFAILLSSSQIRPDTGTEVGLGVGLGVTALLGTIASAYFARRANNMEVTAKDFQRGYLDLEQQLNDAKQGTIQDTQEFLGDAADVYQQKIAQLERRLSLLEQTNQQIESQKATLGDQYNTLKEQADYAKAALEQAKYDLQNTQAQLNSLSQASTPTLEASLDNSIAEAVYNSDNGISSTSDLQNALKKLQDQAKGLGMSDEEIRNTFKGVVGDSAPVIARGPSVAPPPPPPPPARVGTPPPPPPPPPSAQPKGVPELKPVVKPAPAGAQANAVEGAVKIAGGRKAFLAEIEKGTKLRSIIPTMKENLATNLNNDSTIKSANNMMNDLTKTIRQRRTAMGDQPDWGSIKAAKMDFAKQITELPEEQLGDFLENLKEKGFPLAENDIVEMYGKSFIFDGKDWGFTKAADSAKGKKVSIPDDVVDSALKFEPIVE